MHLQLREATPRGVMATMTSSRTGMTTKVVVVPVVGAMATWTRTEVKQTMLVFIGALRMVTQTGTLTTTTAT